MSRLQLAINVTDLDAAVDFYTKMFSTPPARLRPGYANFAITDPPLKLVLFEGDEGATLNHLGVEVETAAEVSGALERLAEVGLDPTPRTDAACCYATKTETWVRDPDGARWEWYVRTGDSETLEVEIIEGPQTCCP